ncbi:hypothetical protein PsorP6_012962 [Peronosclerospora sorghi]|uniref:Uncharacterized protein n=1 Tax=Peronosclerospora sorghi TaxID=230839 RepID=A0ACC0WJ69_9STRA|nr:hypothetical protein PsorP6_012962 [Peronosclerospora sorghi]
MRDTMLHLVKKVTTVPKPTVCRDPSQLRLMGHGPALEEGSLEAKVRKYLPNDYHIVMATLGTYATIYMFYQLNPSKKKEEVVISSGTISSASTSIPSLFDEEFDEWSKLPGNLEKREKSLETLGN